MQGFAALNHQSRSSANESTCIVHVRHYGEKSFEASEVFGKAFVKRAFFAGKTTMNKKFTSRTILKLNKGQNLFTAFLKLNIFQQISTFRAPSLGRDFVSHAWIQVLDRKYCFHLGAAYSAYQQVLEAA